MDEGLIPSLEQALGDSAKIRQVRRRYVGSQLVEDYKTWGLKDRERKWPLIPCPVPGCGSRCKDRQRLKKHLIRIHGMSDREAEWYLP